ncbi:MAG: MqnA/MqnD/SBP family protein, partial [Pyrinomonadaceae bacterium]
WREFTGLGFVFAMWMARTGASDAARGVDFASARDEGLAHAEEIAAGYERELGRSRAELLAYLRDNISFILDAEMLAGLELFYQLAYRHGVIEEVQPLRMLEESEKDFKRKA